MSSRLLAVLIIFPIWLVLVLVFRKHRQWLLYYLVAAFGLTIQLVLLAVFWGVYKILVNAASYHVYLISKYLAHLNINLLSNGRFQIIHPVGGTDILKLGIECSAVLESSILIALIAFYPLFNFGQKVLRITFGLIVTYVINILRLMIIVLMADKFGSDYIFLAHAGVARVFFFICELILYWYLITKPTVKSVGESILHREKLVEATQFGRSLRLKYALTQLATVIVFVILFTSSFAFSSLWRPAFQKVAHEQRPIIYQDETSLEPQEKNVLGENAHQFDEFIIPNLLPGEEYVYRFSVTDFTMFNVYLLESSRPVRLEAFLNEEFQNRSVIGITGEPTLETYFFKDPIEISEEDIIELHFRNLGTEPMNAKIEIETNGGINE